jgi:hypothetical protein
MVRDGADGSFLSDVSLILLLCIFVVRKMPKTQVKTQVKYKKAPQAPRRFKSSYMFFSTAKHKQIRKELSEEKGELKKVGQRCNRISVTVNGGVYVLICYR